LLSECGSLQEALTSKRAELRQRERRLLEAAEAVEAARGRSKQLESMVESLQNQLRLEQVTEGQFLFLPQGAKFKLLY
jgi:uncharacterized membrane-anchored protein